MPTSPQRFRSLILAFVLLILVGWLDYITGYEISLFIFYAFPIALAAWSLGLSWGIAFSILATVAWRWADINHPYSHSWIFWEKGLNGLILFSFIAFSFHFFKSTQDRAKQRLRELESVLPICTVCHRIDNGKGHWVDFELHLKEHSRAEAHRSICQDCASAKYMTDITL